MRAIVDNPNVVRARDWWVALSRREQWLVGILGGLLVLAVLVYGVVKPLQAARARALADIRTYETLNARLRAAGTLGPRVPQRTGPAISVVQQSAAGFGLTPQLEQTANGARAVLTDAPYDAVMNWMADVARSSAVAATRVEIVRAGAAGRVNATVEFTG